MSLRFYLCNYCGKMITLCDDSITTNTICCNAEMKELIPNTTDAAHEKHVPVISHDGHCVTIDVGEDPHPMTDEHYIEWIKLVTNEGIYTKFLIPNTKPVANFILQPGETPVKAYAYCNLHGLWST